MIFNLFTLGIAVGLQWHDLQPLHFGELRVDADEVRDEGSWSGAGQVLVISRRRSP